MREAIKNSTASDEQMHEDWCAEWVHGLTYFRKEWSKMEYDRPVQMNVNLCSEVERYLRLREEAGIQSTWLFPDPNKPDEPLGDDDARLLLERCERTARAMIRKREGREAAELAVPELGDQKWHGFRALWENLRDDLGWFLNKNAAWAGGWTTKIGGPQDSAYRRLKPHYIFAIACGKSVLEVIELAKETERARKAIQTHIPFGEEAGLDQAAA